MFWSNQITFLIPYGPDQKVETRNISLCLKKRFTVEELTVYLREEIDCSEIEVTEVKHESLD